MILFLIILSKALKGLYLNSCHIFIFGFTKKILVKKVMHWTVATASAHDLS